MKAMATVSIVIPVYNEAAAIGECLERVLSQTVSASQVIVADGGSTDDTVEIVRMFAASHHALVLIPNEARIQAAGLNEALKRATGDVLVRVDARSFLAPDYVERCLAALDEHGADVAGGRMMARPAPGLAPRAIALANGAWWGAGPAQFHHSSRSGFVDTVYLGAFRRERVEEVDGWSEVVGVNEDAELNHRIRARGGRIWYDAAIAVAYEPRTTLSTVRRQYGRYGWSRAATAKRHPRSVRLRQVVPAALPPLLLAATLARGPTATAARGALIGHVAVVLAGASSRRGETLGVRAVAAIAAATMHWSWAFGFWRGLTGLRCPGGATVPARLRRWT